MITITADTRELDGLVNEVADEAESQTAERILAAHDPESGAIARFMAERAAQRARGRVDRLSDRFRSGGRGDDGAFASRLAAAFTPPSGGVVTNGPIGDLVGAALGRGLTGRRRADLALRAGQRSIGAISSLSAGGLRRRGARFARTANGRRAIRRLPLAFTALRIRRLARLASRPTAIPGFILRSRLLGGRAPAVAFAGAIVRRSLGLPQTSFTDPLLFLGLEQRPVTGLRGAQARFGLARRALRIAGSVETYSTDSIFARLLSSLRGRRGTDFGTLSALRPRPQDRAAQRGQSGFSRLRSALRGVGPSTFIIVANDGRVFLARSHRRAGPGVRRTEFLAIEDPETARRRAMGLRSSGPRRPSAPAPTEQDVAPAVEAALDGSKGGAA